jgi:protein-disulfide isomerase
VSTPTRDTRQERRRRAREQRLAQERAARERERRHRRLWQVGAVLVVAAAVVGVLIAVSQGGGQRKLKAGQPVPGAATTRALFSGIPQHGIALGSPNAPVTLVEFADLQCPFCRLYTENVLPTLVARYVRTGKVRIVFRNLAFIGPDSVAAAQMAAAAGQQDRLWQFVDLFYANQQEENSGYVTDSFLRQIASNVPGLDVAQAMRARSNPAVQAQLQAASALAGRYGIHSTPSFLLGRRGQPRQPMQYGSLSPDAFTGPIDKALGR